MALDKHTLKANALSSMRATIAHEWSAFNIHNQINRNEGVAREMYKNAEEMIKIEMDFEMKQVYKYLKEYFENG